MQAAPSNKMMQKVTAAFNLDYAPGAAKSLRHRPGVLYLCLSVCPSDTLLCLRPLHVGTGHGEV